MKYNLGEEVYVLDEGQQDSQIGSWEYIQNNRFGIVRDVIACPDQESQIVIEFPSPFPGGHHCNHKAQPQRGQYFMESHIRPAYVQTVPNIDRPNSDRPGEP